MRRKRPGTLERSVDIIEGGDIEGDNDIDENQSNVNILRRYPATKGCRRKEFDSTSEVLQSYIYRRSLFDWRCLFFITISKEKFLSVHCSSNTIDSLSILASQFYVVPRSLSSSSIIVDPWFDGMGEGYISEGDLGHFGDIGDIMGPSLHLNSSFPLYLSFL